MMTHTQINGYVPLRSSDVTADDDALVPETLGANMLSDFTNRDCLDLDEAWNNGEIICWAEGVDNDTFGVEIWGLAKGPYTRRIGTLMADITGTLGTAIADVSNPDNTSRLFADDMTISEQYHLTDISAHDNNDNRICKLTVDFNGLSGLCARFYNVGGAGEAERINLWMRPF
ncbi:MAG TPA: hypothetical protein HPP87_07295 [Planctomycetes bacterium]|nr:hypothetical protein [Planctomycetota bacterium]